MKRTMMKQSKLKYIAVSILAFVLVASAEENMLLSYRTFIDYANEGKVKSVVISEFGNNELKVTVDNDGTETTYYVDKPYRAGEDVLLIDFLTGKKIPHQILKEDIHNSGRLFPSLLPVLAVFALPLILLLVMAILGFIILSKISHVERMLETEKRK